MSLNAATHKMVSPINIISVTILMLTARSSVLSTPVGNLLKSCFDTSCFGSSQGVATPKSEPKGKPILPKVRAWDLYTRYQKTKGVSLSPADIANHVVELYVFCNSGNADVYKHFANIEACFDDAKESFPDLNKGHAYLYQAAIQDQGAAVSAMLRRGADPNVVGNDKLDTPLHVASFMGNWKIVKILLESQTYHKTNLDARNLNGETPLINAAMSISPPAPIMAGKANYVECVRLLLKHGAKWNLEDKEGKSADYFAKKRMNTEIIELLNGRSTPGNTPVPQQTATPPKSRVWDLFSIRYQKLNGVAFNNADFETHMVGLYDCCLTSNLNDVCYVVDYSSAQCLDDVHEVFPDINKVHRGFAGTYLHEAVMTNQLIVASEMMARGANPNLSFNQEKRTPLHYAAFIGNYKMVKLLLENPKASIKANPNVLTTARLSPLILAAWSHDTSPSIIPGGPRFEECASILISHGAKRDLKDIVGKTAMDYAIETKNAAMQSVLSTGK